MRIGTPQKEVDQKRRRSDMSARQQIREGFRRIGHVLGWIAVAICLVVEFVLAKLPEPDGVIVNYRWWSVDDRWWSIAYETAVYLPAAYLLGFTFARAIGWVISGFTKPDRDALPQDPIEAAQAEILKSAIEKDGPMAAAVINARWKFFPFLIYLAWVVAWIAADYTVFLFARLWAWNEDLPPLPWGAIPIVAGLSKLEIIELWMARGVVGAGVFGALLFLFRRGGSILADAANRRYRPHTDTTAKET
jgi:hypothetical protein